MGIVVETGAGVSGANSLVSPGFAASYFADRGTLSDAGEYPVTAAVFAPTQITVPSNGANVPVNSIISVEGASLAGNVGFGYVSAVSGDLLTVKWMDLAAETVDVTLTVWSQEGWWSTCRRLEASLINATEFCSSRSWYGQAASDIQGTPFPRVNLVTRAASQYYKAGVTLSSEEVPLAVQHAVCQLAVEDLTTSLVEVVRPGQQLKSKRVGPISKTFDNPRGLRTFPHVDRMLWGLHSRRSAFRPLSAGAR